MFGVSVIPRARTHIHTHNPLIATSGEGTLQVAEKECGEIFVCHKFHHASDFKEAWDWIWVAVLSEPMISLTKSRPNRNLPVGRKVIQYLHPGLHLVGMDKIQ